VSHHVPRKEVQVGQCYREVDTSFIGSSMALWSIERVFVGTDSFHYAWILNAADRTSRKTLSLAVLGDRRRYVLEEDRRSG
jgi:hypothetical protein